MKVALYINTKKEYDPSLDLVIERFEDRVLADGGTFEAFNCLKNQVDSLGGVSGIALNTITDFAARVLADGGVFESENCLLNTINDLGGVVPEVAEKDFVRRIELFQDEKISLTSSVQNVNDISKVFTDYSQSFTIPASENNNEIFRHWYENSLERGFDQRTRYTGYIELDTQTFRTGKWQLESATVKNNRVEDYRITFYGELKSLTDKFGEDKLKDVQTLNDYSINYTGANVLSRVKSSTIESVMFPFISSSRLWNIGGSGSGLDNINTSAYRLGYKELYPAVQLTKIFNAIEDRYNLNFTGSFLSDNRFTSAYLWFKNNEQAEVSVLGQPVTIDILGSNSNVNRLQTNVINNTVTLIEEDPFNNTFLRIQMTFPVSVSWQISIYRNNIILGNLSGTGSSVTENIIIPNEDLGIEYRFGIATSEVVAYTGSLSAVFYDENDGTDDVEFLNNIGGTTLNILNLTALAPDIRVTDFFSGVLKMFNLTAFSEDGVNFTLEQLENWYYLGGIKDFSEYCTTDLDFNRIKPFKKIDFKYQKSESFMNRAFFENSQREYGDLNYGFPYDGGDYTIQLPFENLLFNRFTNYFQVGYALKQDFTKYVPKPIILYRYGLEDATYYFNNGTTTTQETEYNAFGQDTLDIGFMNTINWGVEISSLNLQLVNNSLFNNYYLAYLNNLYSLKSRMIKVKMRLPYLELLNLKLNDRIVIRDKRYIINQYTTDLTTFESDFELIQDFRSVSYNNSTIGRVGNAATVFDVATTSAEPLTWSVDFDPTGMITGVISNDSSVTIQVKQNVSGLERNAVIISNLNDRIIVRQDA
jgi:hypothetical protein